MWLDADDIITEENKEKILKLKEGLNPNIDIAVTLQTLAGGTQINSNASILIQRLS